MKSTDVFCVRILLLIEVLEILLPVLIGAYGPKYSKCQDYQRCFQNHSMDMMKHEPASGGETLASSSEGNDQLIDMKQETELEVDFAKVTANIDSDIGSMTRVQEDYLVADKQCLDPVSFVKIKIEVKHNMNAIKVEPDLYKTLPVSSLSSNKLVHVKQEEYSAFPNLDWETEHSLNKVKVMDDSNTDSDSVNADSEGKLVDNKPLLDHIEFVAVKAEVTEELCGDTAIKEECKDEVTIEEHDPIPQGPCIQTISGATQLPVKWVLVVLSLG
ncbi:uncharacterized protein LOC110840379 isoform X9 [Zootermopsis nevadensis]|uniref:uncharacterized protein LOC110840379 isoform X9 n=1 Tax=Zootermopsis nevadensis TaxID=136037 RepID=UPI000B8E5175|nr:uncharacterized protein LOC110840379 isoform X9 [Zootermopsis nevadensis]